MKKLAKLSVIALIVLMVLTTVVCAATEDDLKKEVVDLVSKLNLERTYTSEIDTIFDAVDLTEEQVNEIQSYFDDIDKILAEYDYNVEKLTKEVKNQIFDLAQSAANIAGLNLFVNYDAKTVEVVKDGKVIVAVSYDVNLVQTGSNNLVIAGLAVVAIVALAATAVVKKAKTNE